MKEKKPFSSSLTSSLSWHIVALLMVVCALPQPGWQEWRQCCWALVVYLWRPVKRFASSQGGLLLPLSLIKSPNVRPQMEFPQTVLWGLVTNSLWKLCMTLLDEEVFRKGSGEVLFSCSFAYRPHPQKPGWSDTQTASWQAWLCFEV